ncbi:ComEC/Rec2 family competence protein [Candidatus Saccharibacteria bacterium]|nr:ComEC/Rec2 family competence protein [Candidatus Saccharibacteria bacterium]
MKQIHPSWHVLFFALGVIFGDIFILTTQQTLFAGFVWLIFGIILLIFCIFCPRRITLVLAIFAGFIMISCRTAPNFAARNQLHNFIDQTITISGSIMDDPETSDGKTVMHLSTDAGPVYVSLPKTENLRRSDKVTITGKLGAGFGTYVGSFYRPELVEIIRPEPGDIALKIRDWFAGLVRQNIKSPEADLGLGYLLGLRSGIPDDVDNSLRVIGLTHIIVASGAHLGILVSVARKFFGKLSRFAGLFMALIFIGGFVCIVGLTPSMARAGLVSALSLIAAYFGRKFSPARLLTLVAAITLLINPSYPMSLGWLLSFASFAGIMIVGPWLTKYLYGDKKPHAVVELLLSSASASLLCTPILLYFFGSVSLISLLANLLVPPTISLAMGLIFATGALSFLPPVAGIFGWLATLVLDYQLFVINILGNQIMFLLEISPGNPLVFLFYLIFLPPLIKKLLSCDIINLCQNSKKTSLIRQELV